MRASTLPYVLTSTLILLAACQPPVGTADAELVTSFRADPVVNTYNQPVDVRYSLRRPALVTLRVTQDAEGDTTARRLVYLMQEDQKETSGTHHTAWLGTAADGFFAPKGTYYVELLARTSGSQTPQYYSVPVYVYRN